MNYEDIEDDDERIAQYFGNLSIDMQNDKTSKSKLFYIELE